MKRNFIFFLCFCLCMFNFVQPVKADETENAILGTSAVLTDPNMLNLVYDEDLDLEQSYQEKGLMNLDVSRTLSETDEDYCSRFEQFAKEQTAFAVSVPADCLQYFESSNNLLPVTYFYGDEPVPYFVSTAFLATGAVIALGGLLASTYYFTSSDSFVNSVYGTFNKLADNAKTNLSNLFSNNTAYNNVSTDLFLDIHSNLDIYNGKFSTLLGYKYNTYYPLMLDYVDLYSLQLSGADCIIKATAIGKNPEFSYNGNNFNLVVGKSNVINGGSVTIKFDDATSAEKGCSLMNFGTVFTTSYRGYGTPDASAFVHTSLVRRSVTGYNMISMSIGGYMSTSWRSYDEFGIFVGPTSTVWNSLPTLNVDEVDFYKNGSVTIGKFPDSLLDYTTTDVQTGAITGVLRPPLTNTQTGEKVETVVPTTPPPTGGGTVPPPVLPEEDFNGWGFDIDFSPLFQVGEKFLNVFPFSLIRDFTQVLEIFDADPQVPKFEIPIFDGNSVLLDLSFANSWSSFFRSTFNFVYSALLAYYLFKRISL